VETGDLNAMLRSMPKVVPRRTAVRAAAVMLALQAWAAVAGAGSCAAGEEKQAAGEPTRTGKERLGGKASDEQRIDNCNVPPELRGPKPRPDQCRAGADPAPMR
jgi:hypothetical protein